MHIRSWKQEVFTIPNCLSILRLGLIPVYCRLYLRANTMKDYILAAGILGFSCLTDAVDGFIARKFHMQSSLGKILDPIADKATQITLTVCLSLNYPVLMLVMCLLVAKEVFQILGAVVLVKRGAPLPSAMMAGKVSTAVLFVSLIALVLLPDAPDGMINFIVILDSGFLVFAFSTYYLAFFRKTGVKKKGAS